MENHVMSKWCHTIMMTIVYIIVLIKVGFDIFALDIRSLKYVLIASKLFYLPVIWGLISSVL